MEPKTFRWLMSGFDPNQFSCGVFSLVEVGLMLMRYAAVEAASALATNSCNAAATAAIESVVAVNAEMALTD